MLRLSPASPRWQVTEPHWSTALLTQARRIAVPGHLGLSLSRSRPDAAGNDHAARAAGKLRQPIRKFERPTVRRHGVAHNSRAAMVEAIAGVDVHTGEFRMKSKRDG